MAFSLLLVEFLLADPANVRQVVLLGNRRMAGRIVITFVQTEMLRILVGGFGPIGHDRFDGRPKQFGVMHVRSGYHHAQRAAVSFDNQATLGSILAPIGGVPPDVAPPKRAFPIAPSALCHCQSTPPSSSQLSIN